MHVILVSNLYPHALEPQRALYNQRHFAALQALGDTVEVIAPLPWFPGKRGLPPTSEVRDGVSVLHPRHFYTPGFAIHLHWRFYQSAVRGTLRQRIAASDELVHVVLGFVYPDAVAMAPVCEALGVSYSVLVLGSDFRVRMQQPKFRPLVQQCLQRAPHVFCPGETLRSDMIAAGIAPGQVHAFNNGVERDVFYYEPATAGTGAPQEILFVGNLVDVKAPERLLRAFAAVAERVDPALRLTFIGDGPLRGRLLSLAAELGITARVDWLGRQPPAQVAERMRGAQGLCLCSRSEGMPNVVIEALACGCPVVATAVGEVPVLIEPGLNGYVVPTQVGDEPAVEAELAAALLRMLQADFDRAAIAARMTDFTWEAAAQVLADVIDPRAECSETREIL